MGWIAITQNGDIAIKVDKNIQSTISVLAPLTMNGATVIIGYFDLTDSFVPLIDGALASAGQVYARAGSEAALFARVTGFTSDFSILASIN